MTPRMWLVVAGMVVTAGAVPREVLAQASVPEARGRVAPTNVPAGVVTPVGYVIGADDLPEFLAGQGVAGIDIRVSALDGATECGDGVVRAGDRLQRHTKICEGGGGVGLDLERSLK